MAGLMDDVRADMCANGQLVGRQVPADTPGISRCQSQHVPVESSSLLHHSIHL